MENMTYTEAAENIAKIYNESGIECELSKPYAEDRDGWLCVSWDLTFKRNGREAKPVHYSMGIACVDLKKAARRLHPGFSSEIDAGIFHMAKGSRLTDRNIELNVIDYCIKKGCLCNQPNPAEVLASIAAEGKEAAETYFEEWAENLGYDTDSRKAEAAHRACRDHWPLVLSLVDSETATDLAELSRLL